MGSWTEHFMKCISIGRSTGKKRLILTEELKALHVSGRWISETLKYVDYLNALYVGRLTPFVEMTLLFIS